MKHHKDIDELLQNSPIRTKRRIKTIVMAFLALLVFILTFTAILKANAQMYKESAMKQLREQRMAQNISIEKAEKYLNQIKTLTANYNK